MAMFCEKTKDINIVQVSCSDKDRHLPPTPKAIAAMKASLEKHGQIHPIGVYPITQKTYRLISGATRFRAASEMGWEKIRASIWIGSDIDFQIHELTENLDRRELNGTTRREMKARIKALQKLRLADVQTARGGRGKKGGVSEAARQEGMARSTAQRRQQEAKPAQNPNSGQVSGDASSRSAASYMTKKISVAFTVADMDRLRTLAEAEHISMGELIRRTVLEKYGTRSLPKDPKEPEFSDGGQQQWKH